ncbi:branched-chain amino acid aminotransferase [Boletus edulis]|nr:branched-chain amino acid aminotransferase [Boletus edulis]
MPGSSHIVLLPTSIPTPQSATTPHLASRACSVAPPSEETISAWVTSSHARTGPGGLGNVKAGGNYSNLGYGREEAANHGCDEIMYLDAVIQKKFEECGVKDRTFLTPSLCEGTILAGVTRNSLLTLAGEAGCRVVEGDYTLEACITDVKNGQLLEIITFGTSVVVQGVLFETLNGIQHGEIADIHGWVHTIE